MNEQVIDEYRETGGSLSGPLAGQQVLLVTHKGARTGKIRTTPLGYFDSSDGGDYLRCSCRSSNPDQAEDAKAPEVVAFFACFGTPVVFASSMGAPKHPQWYFNLVANPDVAVELGDTQFAATARVVEGPERDALWSRVIEEKHFLAAHQLQTGGRQIPLIRLEVDA